METNFLQSIKLEISRNFKLVPYERIAFHKILGILKTDIGMEILKKELDKGPDIRESALAILSSFPQPQVTEEIVRFLSQAITENEKMVILDHLERLGSQDEIGAIIEFIESIDAESGSRYVIARAFQVLRKIGADNHQVLDFLFSKIDNDEIHIFVRSQAILSLSSFSIISKFEEVLKDNNDELCYYVYRAIDELNVRIQKSGKMKEDDLYTYSPSVEEEDKVILDIRVLLGKMAPRFDEYSAATKVAFINAMISCNHREYLIYVMKALTSGEPDLVSMTLYGLHRNIDRLKDPDKLFRSLIALSTEDEVDNETIVDIFVKFFSIVGDDRKYHILKDKTYSNIVVTLETYFETYRREFMIRDVVEKSFPETFRQIRKFILEKMTPELKKKTVGFLNNEESRTAIRLIEELSEWINYVSKEQQEQLYSLVEIFFDNDKKSRENSASRIEDINFEKRYLRNRIIRLCHIISRLNIEEAASPLVNIYNYLKKYPDPHLSDTIVHTLSSLNYSYMLGEIEVLLFTGTEQDQVRALELISYFTEQRSLNMLFEYLQGHLDDENECVAMCMEILLDHDINNNITANQIFKKVIEVNQNKKIRSLAILGVGRCGLEQEIEFLNDIFFTIKDSEEKDAVVRAIGEISSLNPEIKKRQVMKYFQEYLKDPGIRVRIYSCLFLIKLGDSEAIRAIREMLIIKNKGIQRDILTILGDLKSLEFSFFLISLLKEEYGMTDDIIEVLRLLPQEELKEIDGFIINIFRKYEAPDLGENISAEKPGPIQLKNLKRQELTLLYIDVSENEEEASSTLSGMISKNIRIKSFISSAITVQEGIISLITGSRVVSFFTDPVKAVRASMAISENIRRFNQSKRHSRRINLYSQIITGMMAYFNDELVYYPVYMIDDMEDKPLHNKILLDRHTSLLVKDIFYSKIVSELVFSNTVSVNDHYEIQNPINFRTIAEGYLERLFREREEKERTEAELEAEMKNMRRSASTPSSATIARDLENLGNRLMENLNEIEKYIQRRSTDRELNKNVHKMLINAYNMYKAEISKLIIE